jgi:hypothetical protein
MKRLLPLLAVLLLVSGCKKDNIVILTPVHVSLGDFEVINDDQTTAKDEPLATYSGVKAVTLAFYNSAGVLAYSSTQLRADSTTFATFGEFDLALAMGSYIMEVFAYGSDYPLTLNGMTEAAYTVDKVRETFVATQAVNIASTSPVNINVTLNRINSRLRVESTDLQPVSIDSIRITYSAGGRNFNPLTGFATVNNGLVNSIKSAAGENIHTNANSYIFLNANEQYVDITIDAIDTSSAVVFHKEIINVPLRRNAVTTLQGSMYSAAASSLFTLHTDYDSLIVISF